MGRRGELTSMQQTFCYCFDQCPQFSRSPTSFSPSRLDAVFGARLVSPPVVHAAAKRARRGRCNWCGAPTTTTCADELPRAPTERRRRRRALLQASFGRTLLAASRSKPITSLAQHDCGQSVWITSTAHGWWLFSSNAKALAAALWQVHLTNMLESIQHRATRTLFTHFGSSRDVLPRYEARLQRFGWQTLQHRLTVTRVGLLCRFLD
ncbi:uncharacterized protein LOC125942685 [Dermacentor silvarum]|uniref:uncharacterized protein LOC125942685 n=1 Tax=Dermacentor silvarum TaxID=543639 RepID=UPI002101CEF0|nr:uncharacterized protein LOC125942685 [Dermacentor silvarum]